MTNEQAGSLEPLLGDPIWRLTSGELYKIAPADGSGVVPFKPRQEQIEVINAIHVDGSRQILIPKARRLGMSTVLGIVLLDMAIFRPGFQISLVDQNAADAERKLDRIVKVAINNLPGWLRDRITLDPSNAGQVGIILGDKEKSDYYAGKNARGGSNDCLWISEWGVIQYEDPKRSAKIRSGALPSARHGLTIVETTWAGGQQGDLWEIMEPSIMGHADDWRVMFFPWHLDPRNVHPAAFIDERTRHYFQTIAPRAAKMGIEFTEDQMRWYAQEWRSQGVFMRRENPTFIDECWSTPVPGAIIATKLEEARAEGRITSNMPVSGSDMVFTAWDLGSNKNTVVWYFQVVGREIRVIDCDRITDKMESDGRAPKDLAERVARMHGKGYNYQGHFLPHDGGSDKSGQGSMQVALEGYGLSNIQVLKRTHDVWVGLNHMLELFSSMSFRLPACQDGLEALMAYRVRTAKEGGTTSGEIVHDWASHSADALRTLAEAHMMGHFSFKHTDAVQDPGRWQGRRKRKPAKPARVGG